MGTEGDLNEDPDPQRLGQSTLHSQTGAIAARVPWWEDPFMLVNGLPPPIITVGSRGPNRLLGTPKEIPFRSDRCLRPASVHEVP